MQRTMNFLRQVATLLAIFCMVVAVLGVGGAFVDRLDIFNHFAPVTLALAVVATAILVSFRKATTQPALACAFVAIAVSAAMMAPEFIAKATAVHVAPRRQTIKVIELNLWSNNIDARRTARWLAGQNADVVILEEVITNGAEVPTIVKATYPYQSGCEPDVACTTLILSRTRPIASGGYPSPDALGLHSAGWATFGVGVEAFTVVGDHAPWPVTRGHQQDQTALLASRLEAFDRASLIIAGDFNSTPWSFALRRQDAMFGLTRRTRALFTFPVQRYSRYRIATPIPILALDHIYAGASWKTVSVGTGPRLGSDHLPTVAVLTR